jgi:hypothetical protein
LLIGLILVVVVSLVTFSCTKLCFRYVSMVSNPVPRADSFAIVVRSWPSWKIGVSV